MQAAILRARLPFLPRWTSRRRALAARYREALAGTAVRLAPELEPGHVYHLFVALADDRAARDELRARLASDGIETLIHYPVPIPQQPAFAGTRPADCPTASHVCDTIVSLPLNPAMSDAAVDFVAAAARKVPGGRAACGR